MTKTEQENEMSMQTIVIIILLIIIVVMWYFLGQKSVTPIVSTDPNNNIASTVTENDWTYEELTVTIYDDKRCTNCPTDLIVQNLQSLPSIQNSSVIQKDFLDEGVETFLNENNITALPLIVFSTKSFDVSNDPIETGSDWQVSPKITGFLQELPKWGYYLDVQSTFNPFVERSDRGFLFVDKDILSEIKENSYIKWNTDAKITRIEYSDLECPFCAKLHNAWTGEDLEEKYWDDLNIIYNHFPLWFHDNAQTWAEILECLWEEKWIDAFYSLIEKSYSVENSTKEFLITEAVALWWSRESIETCLDEGRYTQKVKDEMARWTSLFEVTWTPWNVLINNETWEYEVISWAYPTSAFEELIEKLK